MESLRLLEGGHAQLAKGRGFQPVWLKQSDDMNLMQHISAENILVSLLINNFPTKYS